MLTIKAPSLYACEPGLLTRAGGLLSRYGHKACIIAGKRAWRAASPALVPSLEKWRIGHEVGILPGYPTYERVLHFATESARSKADFIIGVGGGRVCDLAKGVGNLRGIPVVTVPTVAGTCACWAARSILYTDEGDFDRILWNARNPDMVLADVDILLRAPKRYLAAGIMDTVAKWYEFEPLIDRSPNDLVLRQDVAVARLAREILEEKGPGAMGGAPNVEAFRQVLDAIFFLAGSTGSFASGAAYQGFAHPWYYATTRIPESRHRLHGEKVAFGLLLQFILTGADAGFIDGFVRQLAFYGMTDVPEDWQAGDPCASSRRLSEIIVKEHPDVIEKGFVRDADHCAAAIDEASERLRKMYG